MKIFREFQHVLKKSLAGGAVMTLLLVQTTVSHAGTFAAPMIEDTFIVHSTPNNNFSGNRFVQMRNFSTVTRAGLAQFQLPALPPLELVTSAQLTIFSAANGSGQPNMNVVGINGTQPNLSTATWNTAVSGGLITGRNGTTFEVQWGANATVFTGEPFNISAGTTGNTLTYTDSTDASGLLKYILDNAGAAPSTITLGFSMQDNPAHDAIYQFRSNNDDNAGGTVAVPPGPVTATLTLFTETQPAPPAPIPEPSSMALLILGCAFLVRSKRKRD